MTKTITPDNVIAHLIKEGWSNKNATAFCDRYYDLALLKRKNTISQIAEFCKWKALWYSVTEQD